MIEHIGFQSFDVYWLKKQYCPKKKKGNKKEKKAHLQ
jgi:hypothetical protein